MTLQKPISKVEKLIETRKGGFGSGNFGHGGIPGKRGGSTSKGVGGSKIERGIGTMEKNNFLKELDIVELPDGYIKDGIKAINNEKIIRLEHPLRPVSATNIIVDKSKFHTIIKREMKKQYNRRIRETNEIVGAASVSGLIEKKNR